MSRPDWCDEKTWERATYISAAAMHQPNTKGDFVAFVARQLLSAQGEAKREERERCMVIARSFDDRTDILKISGVGVALAISNGDAS